MKQAACALGMFLTATAGAAEERPLVVRLEAGSATLHQWNDAKIWGQVRIGRLYSGGRLSADLGAVASGSAEGYFDLTVGIEVLPFPTAALSPYARAEVGGLLESDGLYGTARVGGGLAVRLTERLSLRGGASWGVHSDLEGPIVYHGGVELRF